MRPSFLSYALPLLLAAAPASAALSPAEKQMAAQVDKDMESAIVLLQKLVDQNSGTRNLEGVTKVGTMMRAELEALGLKVEWKPMTQTNRAGHIIATHKGKPGTKRLLLIGHLDTVFEPSSPFQHFERKGDRASGPGVGDDKGGMVVMLLALQAMKAAGTLNGANIEIHLTGDEESAGAPIEQARTDLIAAGKRSDVALDFEGLVVIDGQDMGSVARRSSTSYVIHTTGKSAHSSGIFSPAVGDGAIYELGRIITAFRTELPEPNLTFNIGIVGGGAQAALSADEATITARGKTNIIPATAIATGDYRALTAEQVARVRTRMEAIVSRHLPGTSASIEFKEGYPPMAPTAGNRAILARLNAVNADLGLPAMPELDPLKRGAGDVSFVAADVDSFAGMGPDSDGDHTPDESVDLTSFSRQAKRAALLMSRLAASGR